MRAKRGRWLPSIMGLDLEGKNDDSVFTLRRRQRRWKPVLQGVRCTIDGGDGGDGTAGRCGTGDACVHDAAADFGFTGSSIGTGSSISAVSGAAAATGTDDRDVSRSRARRSRGARHRLPAAAANGRIPAAVSGSDVSAAAGRFPAVRPIPAAGRPRSPHGSRGTGRAEEIQEAAHHRARHHHRGRAGHRWRVPVPAPVPAGRQRNVFTQRRRQHRHPERRRKEDVA